MARCCRCVDHNSMAAKSVKEHQPAFCSAVLFFFFVGIGNLARSPFLFCLAISKPIQTQMHIWPSISGWLYVPSVRLSRVRSALYNNNNSNGLQVNRLLFYCRLLRWNLELLLLLLQFTWNRAVVVVPALQIICCLIFVCIKLFHRMTRLWLEYLHTKQMSAHSHKHTHRRGHTSLGSSRVVFVEYEEKKSVKLLYDIIRCFWWHFLGSFNLRSTLQRHKRKK